MKPEGFAISSSTTACLYHFGHRRSNHLVERFDISPLEIRLPRYVEEFYGGGGILLRSLCHSVSQELLHKGRFARMEGWKRSMKCLMVSQRN
jgi:hypothetical protein